MSPIVTMMISLFLNILLYVSLLPWTSTAFTLNLVHRDSPHSPLYQHNLSDFDRFMKNIEISNARASYFEQFVQSQSIRLPLKYVEPLFTVEIGLGTPVVKRTLILDTGSSLTWTQCKPCLLCFKQEEPLFDPKGSHSYKKVTKGHQLSSSFTCNKFGCFYYIGYYSSQFTLGTVSLENFTFQTSTRHNHTVPDLVFGCGNKNVGSFPRKISGILGLGKEPESFARQLGTLIKGRFSYCLNSNTSYVSFGDEAKIRGRNGQRTPFLKGLHGDMVYTTNLNGISIEGRTLGLTSGSFPGGCVIDSGSSFSLLPRRAFAATTSFLTTYFAKFNVRKYVGKDVPKEFVCYTQPRGFVKLPSIIFHFDGANFHIPPENLFFYFNGANFFCLAMAGSPNTTILGAFQQRNVRMVYDLKEEMLSFASEKC